MKWWAGYLFLSQNLADKKRILLVDDEPDITLTMSRGLQNHGLRVESYNEATFALSEFKPNYYSMIILDVRMPGMTGFELAKKFWEIDPDARICFFSAFEIYEEEARVAFKSMKTVRFIKKPIAPSELAKYIDELLRGPPLPT